MTSELIIAVIYAKSVSESTRVAVL